MLISPVASLTFALYGARSLRGCVKSEIEPDTVTFWPTLSFVTDEIGVPPPAVAAAAGAAAGAEYAAAAGAAGVDALAAGAAPLPETVTSLELPGVSSMAPRNSVTLP